MPDPLELARRHLARVQVAWVDPVDRSDLYLYGLYALENAVVVAANHFQVAWKRTHPSKVEAARTLHTTHGLPDIADLLEDINELRKAEAYGEALPQDARSADDIAAEVERYVEAVAAEVASDGN